MRHILKKRHNVLPPYCKDSSVLESCNKCSNSPCIDICKEDIIKKDNNGIYLDFTNSGCVFCKKCAIVCKEDSFGVLDLALGNMIFATISINQSKCLAWKKTLCSYCLDVCESKSIVFVGSLYPQIDQSCTKCGMCKSVCPTDAIIFWS